MKRAVPPARTAWPAFAWRYPTNPPAPVSTRMPAMPAIAKAATCAQSGGSQKFGVSGPVGRRGYRDVAADVGRRRDASGGRFCRDGAGRPGGGPGGVPAGPAPPAPPPRPIGGATITGSAMGAAGPPGTAAATAPTAGVQHSGPVGLTRPEFVGQLHFRVLRWLISRQLDYGAATTAAVVFAPTRRLARVGPRPARFRLPGSVGGSLGRSPWVVPSAVPSASSLPGSGFSSPGTARPG